MVFELLWTTIVSCSFSLSHESLPTCLSYKLIILHIAKWFSYFGCWHIVPFPLATYELLSYICLDLFQVFNDSLQEQLCPDLLCPSFSSKVYFLVLALFLISSLKLATLFLRLLFLFSPLLFLELIMNHSKSSTDTWQPIKDLNREICAQYLL